MPREVVITQKSFKRPQTIRNHRIQDLLMGVLTSSRNGIYE